MIKSVFICEPIHVAWIIEKLMRDVAAELTLRGISVRIGGTQDYQGEDVVFHARFLYATPIDQARLNSVYVTHVDDYLKEMEVRSAFDKFESFVCLSAHDAAFLKDLGCDESKLLGNNLPHRDGFLRPLRMAVFSARYEDGRKNEDWILEYFARLSPVLRRSVVLCFIGHNWESYSKTLADLDLSFELYRYGRDVPGEYELQKSILNGVDFMLYPGFDGAAMCVYDGIAAGVQLIVADNGFHRGLGSLARLFKDKAEFFARLDEVMDVCRQRHNVWDERSIRRYTDALVHHWNARVDEAKGGATLSDSVQPRMRLDSIGHSEAEVFRSHYKTISLRRLGSTAYRLVRKVFAR